MRIFFTGVNYKPEDLLANSCSLPMEAIRGGHTVCDSLDATPELLICVDYANQYRSVIQTARDLDIPCVLVKQEPVVVAPKHREKNPDDLFSMVITRGVLSEEPKFNTYQEWDASKISEQNRLNRVVAISGNKWSMVPGEYYSLRRQAYARDKRIDLFGPGWNEAIAKQISRLFKETLIAANAGFFPEFRNIMWALRRPQNYMGVAASKVSVLSSYKASLVIENSSGYMSEKLVDCILCGTIPIYVGEDSSSFGIPEDLVIQASPNIESISNAISKALSRDSSSYRRMAESWAGSAGVRDRWECESVNRNLLAHIQRLCL